jgi:hypothetical protein
MSTKRAGHEMPDVVSAEKPVSDIGAVTSAVLDIILKQVDPGITGVQVCPVREKRGSKSGFVLAYIPELDGSPQRSRVDGEFYVRVASGTIPMEYFQIEDRFGRRPHPNLELIFEKRNSELSASTQRPIRIFVLGLRNTGRGIARFPAVWFKRAGAFTLDPFGIDGNGRFGLTRQPSEGNSIIFSGGTENVVYPNQELLIALLTQDSVLNVQQPPFPRGPILRPLGRTYTFPAVRFECSIASEGSATLAANRDFPEETFQTSA